MSTRTVDTLILIARVAIGGVLLIAGALKAGHADTFAPTIAAFRLLPASLVAPLAVGLPFFEIGLGAYLIIGLYTRVAALIALVEFVVFSAAIASVVVRGLPVACGCFGQGDTAPASWLDVLRDIGLAGVAALIAWRAPGMLSVDRRMELP
jgi:uncharacterized membrane protein YphA (DoxX/SURF4 family)